MAQHIQIRIGLAKATDSEVIAIAGAVIAGMTGNPAFPNPPVEIAAVQSAVAQLTHAIAAQAQGGPAATADKNNKRHALIAQLRKLALYVQGNCGNDLAVLLSSGYSAQSTSKAQLPLTKPTIVSVENGNSTQLVVKVDRIVQARCYELQAAALGTGGTPGPWQIRGLFTKSRSMPVNGLTPGTTYTIQVRAVGSTGCSDWSDPVSHMCM